MFRRRTVRRFKRYVALSVIAVFLNLTLPTPTHAANATAQNEIPSNSIVTQAIDATLPPGLPTVPDKPRPVAKRVLTLRSSAYSSTVDQTDGDPFTTASGTQVHPGTVATNCLPFGTQIRIPDYFGDQIFTVEDRMSSRWGCGKMDIWMSTRADALNWGVRTITIEII